MAVLFDFGFVGESALRLPSWFLISMTVVFGFGFAIFLSATSSPTLTASPLPLCFLTSVAVMFGFGVGVALRGSAWPVVVKSVLALVSAFLTSLPSVFGFGAGNDMWRPAAVMSSSWGVRLAKRAGCRRRPARRARSSPAPQDRSARAGPTTADPVSCAIISRLKADTTCTRSIGRLASMKNGE